MQKRFLQLWNSIVMGNATRAFPQVNPLGFSTVLRIGILTCRVPLGSVPDPTGSQEDLDVSQEATRKQHESQKPHEDENPKRTPGKDTQEDNRNPGQDRNNPSNNPNGGPQRGQDRSGTPQNDRDQPDHSRGTSNRQGGPTEQQDNENRKDSNPFARG
jgi:hypothetical protein